MGHVKIGNKKLVTSTGVALGRKSVNFLDSFDRPNGELGNGWIDGHAWNSAVYDPVGIYNGSAVISNATARTGAVYAQDQFTHHPPLNGEQHTGIGCAWQDFGTCSVYVEVEWSGLIDIEAGHHVEGSPVVCVVPSTPEHGLGIWPSERYNTPCFFIASIGNPPEYFPNVIYDYAPVGPHTDGTPRMLV